MSDTSMEKMKVKTFKYNQQLHYEWEATVIDSNDNYIALFSTPGRKLIHHSRNKIFEFDTYSLDFFPFDCCYTAHVDIHKNGEFEYYCNIGETPMIINNEIHFIDLDIDIVKKPNSEWMVVDQDEFEENSIKYRYSVEIKEKALSTTKELLKVISNQEFPFDGFLTNKIAELLKYHSEHLY